ncbi:MAG TPA: uracil-DNA glycosylase [Verrucomicrobiae bacterium]|nr:uracil-DNA glycosylase [Verrucomicrobiae bacterium]
MSDVYQELLEATIAHVKDLKAHGVRFIPVSPEKLAALAALTPAAPVRRAASASPGPVTSRSVAARAQPSIPSAKPVVVELSAAAVPAPSAAIADSPKAAAFEALRKKVLECTQCPPLVAARQNVVFGVGNIDAELMFVGEAPGADEDQAGEPFVGKAGQLLTKIIQAMNLSREKVYIANILKCRPDMPAQESGNRKPTSQEMQTCIPFLHEQIDLIKPKVLVALGGTAVEGLLGQAGGITKLRGNWQTYRGIPLMPTYHPAYLLRNQSITEKRKVWEDMLQVMAKLQMAINDKQRNFFLKAGS